MEIRVIIPLTNAKDRPKFCCPGVTGQQAGKRRYCFGRFFAFFLVFATWGAGGVASILRRTSSALGWGGLTGFRSFCMFKCYALPEELGTEGGRTIAEEKFIEIATDAINQWFCGWYGDPYIDKNDARRVSIAVLNGLRRNKNVTFDLQISKVSDEVGSIDPQFE